MIIYYIKHIEIGIYQYVTGFYKRAWRALSVLSIYKDIQENLGIEKYEKYLNFKAYEE